MSLYALSRDFDLLSIDADRRFHRWLTTFGLPALILALILPFLQLAGLAPGGGVPVPPRYATLAPRVAEPPAVRPEEPKPETKKEVKPKTEKPKVSQEVLKQQQQQKARERASKEINKTFGSIANLLSTPAVSNQQLASSANTSRPGTGGASKAFEQSATSGSKGIGNIAPAARTQSGTGLGQRKTSDVSGPTGLGADPGAPGMSGNNRTAGRSLGEMQEVFDRNKGAFYALYNRALRENPDLVGKLIFDITIEPDGSVSRCVLVKSELGNPELERKFTLLVQQLNFGAKNVPRFNYPNYPLHLLRS